MAVPEVVAFAGGSAPDGSPWQPSVLQQVPTTLAGLSLDRLLDDYRSRLFDQYLPFWNRGGYDRDRGGFMCNAGVDGSPVDEEKFIWFQGRAIWVFSYLYSNFGGQQRWLDMAAKTKEFMVGHMYAGGGKWVEKVARDGTVIEGVGTNVYGWLFAAMGLAEFYLATGNRPDLDLAKESIWASISAYDDPEYVDTHIIRETGVQPQIKGFRSQGHSMLLVSMLTRLLSHHEDTAMEQLQRRHVDLLVSRFWNHKYGIVNEFLAHDYSRLPELEGYMFAGHSVESLWIVMNESLRTKNEALFDTAKTRIRRLLEMCWDYVFEGFGDGDYFVFDTPDRCRGTKLDRKTMWAHCELLIACMKVLETTGEIWAKEWYERVRAFTLKTMPVPGCGVWRLAVDRFGKNVQRPGVSPSRKDIFHQPRMLMFNLQSLDRIIKGRTASRPSRHPSTGESA